MLAEKIRVHYKALTINYVLGKIIPGTKILSDSSKYYFGLLEGKKLSDLHKIWQVSPISYGKSKCKFLLKNVNMCQCYGH